MQLNRKYQRLIFSFRLRSKLAIKFEMTYKNAQVRSWMDWYQSPQNQKAVDFLYIYHNLLDHKTNRANSHIRINPDCVGCAVE